MVLKSPSDKKATDSAELPRPWTPEVSVAGATAALLPQEGALHAGRPRSGSLQGPFSQGKVWRTHSEVTKGAWADLALLLNISSVCKNNENLVLKNAICQPALQLRLSM